MYEKQMNLLHIPDGMGGPADWIHHSEFPFFVVMGSWLDFQLLKQF